MVPVILSGGSGTRLWPLSRRKTPKQFNPLFPENLQTQTTRRLLKFGTPWIVAGMDLRDPLLSHAKDFSIPTDQVLLEPTPRNTAPAVALICRVFELRGMTSQVAGVFSADQLITKVEKFNAAVTAAEQEAAKGKVVLLGIQPTFAATGYGYLELAAAATSTQTVRKFREKPDQETARKFVESGNYCWNAGIFVFRVDTMIANFQKYAPDVWKPLQELRADLANLAEIYAKLPSISVDYAVIEKLRPEELSCVPCDIGWSDVGSWDAMSEYPTPATESLIQVGGGGNYVHSSAPKQYAFAGVSDLIVVETKDAVLVTKKGESQQVKDVVEALKTKSPALLAQHLDEERPWGKFEVLKDTDTFKSKVIDVLPGQQISYQSHNKREEHWLIVDGSGVVILNGEEIPVERGSYVKIPLQAKHRVRNTGKVVMRFVEVQLGSYFGEDDIIRYQDDYQRS